MSQASDRVLRVSWAEAARRDGDGVAHLPARFIVEQGRAVTLVDLRERAELGDHLGTIPGSRHLPMDRVEEAVALGPDALLVLVSARGDRARRAAGRLTALGMTMVAVLEGGLSAWRAAGYATRHDADLPDCVVACPVHEEGGPISLERIRAHVGDADRVRWVKLAAFLLHGKTACVDGRDDHGVIGTPGGDMGELLLALAAAERLGIVLDEAELPRMMDDWVEAFGTFYLHSDLTAINTMIAAMRADPTFPEADLPSRTDPPTAWRKFFRSPPPALREPLREVLVRPAHVGCGHLRLSMLEGGVYGVRPDLVRAALSAFYRRYHDGLPELEFVPLAGAHAEQAVLLVEVEPPLRPFTRVPLISPSVGGSQVFVHHPQVTAFQRDEIAAFLSVHPRFGPLRHQRDALRAELETLGQRQIGATLSRLAKGLPVFRVRFGRVSGFEVFAEGSIGA